MSRRFPALSGKAILAMVRYVFSQGKIRVEEGIVLEPEKRRHPFHPTVLIVVEWPSGRPPPDLEKKEQIHDKQL